MYLHLSLSYLHFAQKLPSFFHRAARSLFLATDTLNPKQFLRLRHWLLSVLNFYEFLRCIAYLCCYCCCCWCCHCYCFSLCVLFSGEGSATCHTKCQVHVLWAPIPSECAWERQGESESACVCVSYQIGNVTYEWYMLSRGNCLLNIAHTPHVSAQITSVCARFYERVQNWFRAYLKLCQCTLPPPPVGIA